MKEFKKVQKEVSESTLKCDICHRVYGNELDVDVSCVVSNDHWEGEHSYCHFDICPDCFVTKVVKLLMETYNIPLYPYELGESDPKYSYKTWDELDKEWGYQRGIKEEDF